MSRFTDLLGDFQAEKRFLVVLEPYDPATGAVVPVYLSSHGFVSEPSDSPANTYYTPRLSAPYTFQRSLFSQGRLSGRSVPGAGTIELNNGDGGLDALATYAWGGRRARVYLGGAGFTLAEFGLIYDGTMMPVGYGDGTITINLRDRSYVFDREVQPLAFAGTGGEGGASLAGTRKPITLGVARGAPGVFLGVDTGLYRYALNDGPIVGVLGVYDNGAPLAYATSPGPGQWRVDPATGVVALGGSPSGTLTFDVIGRRYLSVASGSSVAVGTGARTFSVAAGQRLAPGMRVRALSAADPAGTWMDGTITAYTGTALTVAVDGALGSGSPADWSICPWGTIAGVLRALAVGAGVTALDEAALAALDLYQPATIGYWLPAGGNGLQLLDALADGAGCYWGFDRGGLFEAGRVDLPTAPSAAFGATQILEVERQATDEPAYRIDVRYRRAWTVLSADQLAGIAEADRLAFTQEWRTASASVAAIQAAYPLAGTIAIDSVFDDAASAQAEAARQLSLFGARRDYFKVRLKVQPLGIENGDTAQITHARYGLSAGRALRVVDLAEDMNVFEVEMGLWG